MPPTTEFDNFLVSFSGRLYHAWDFTFYKNNGEVANRVRSELGSQVQDIKIDNDSDISVGTAHGTYFITPTGVVAGGWLTLLKNLSEQNERIDNFAGIMDSLCKSKRSLPTENYGLRIFFRFTPANSMKVLRDLSFEGPLRSIFGDNKVPSDSQTLKFSTKFRRNEFSDLIEVEASVEDIQLRYSRDSVGDFPSFHAFLKAANLKGII